jgi:hypothetical protein
MTQGKKYVVLAVAILVAGAVRMPFEYKLTTELHRERLLSEPINIGTGEKLGQTFSAVSLGGLRTLVATFLNLRAYTHFEYQKWSQVADTYDLIVNLAPKTRYYWDVGSWHLAYNAASYYLYESELPPLRRKLLWKSHIEAGKNFLERGIRNNPDHPALYERLGYLLADPNKVSAFGDPATAYLASYEAYQGAVDTGMARSFTKRAALYSLARVPGREKQALDLLVRIKEEQKKLPPTGMALEYILRHHLNPDRDVVELIDEVFPTRKSAYDVLAKMWQRGRDRFPMYGVAKGLRNLEVEFGVPDEKSILKRPLSAVVEPEDYFK